MASNWTCPLAYYPSQAMGEAGGREVRGMLDKLTNYYSDLSGGIEAYTHYSLSRQSRWWRQNPRKKRAVAADEVAADRVAADQVDKSVRKWENS